MPAPANSTQITWTWGQDKLLAKILLGEKS